MIILIMTTKCTFFLFKGYRASPDIISHQVTTRPHGAHYHPHHHNPHQHQQHQHHQEAVHQHYNTIGRMPTQHHHQGIIKSLTVSYVSNIKNK